MSYCSIRNVARVLDVRQHVSADSLNASNDKDFQVEPGKNNIGLPVYSAPAVVTDASEVWAGLTALFNHFFSQLISLMSAGKDKTTPAPPPLPQPQPAVTPRVLPESVLPTPVVDIPGLSSKRHGAKPENIWSGFRQGPDGNCMTVSAIKAAMYRFGQSPTDIFQQVTKVSEGYRVVMRDGFALTLTDRELIEGTRGSRFKGDDPGMLKDAHFLFAVSAKRAQMENNDRTASRSYQAAVRSLNDGEGESGHGESLQRLGLSKHMRTVRVRDLAAGQLGICNRDRHSVAVIDGREEYYGRRGLVPTRGFAVALM